MTGLNAPPRSPGARFALAAALLLGALWLTLPVRLHRAGDGSSGDECLTLADHPPAVDSTARITLLERCHSVVPNDPVLTADLGMAYEALGRHADADRAYRQALAIDRDDAETHWLLASHLFKQGSVAEARAHAEYALQLQPNRTAIIALLEKMAPGK